MVDAIKKPGWWRGLIGAIAFGAFGFGHATMRDKVVVESEAKWEKWVNGLKQKTPEPLMESVTQDTETNPVGLGAGGA